MEKKYSIGEIAHRLGLTPQALRYFEQKDFIDIDREIENNWRSFSQADFFPSCVSTFSGAAVFHLGRPWINLSIALWRRPGWG